MRKRRHRTEPCSTRNSPHNQPHTALRCSTHLSQWIFDRFGSWISYKFHSPTPQQHVDQVRPHMHIAAAQGGSRQLLFSRLNCDALLSTWAINSWAYVAFTWAHMLKQIVCVSLLHHPFIQTLQTVHLIFLPLQGELLSSVGAATESIKAYCILVQLLPLVGGKLRHRRTHFPPRSYSKSTAEQKQKSVLLISSPGLDHNYKWEMKFGSHSRGWGSSGPRIYSWLLLPASTCDFE